MLKTRALVATGALAAVVVVLVAGGAGGQSEPGLPATADQGVREQAALNHSLKSCDAKFGELDVGTSFAGLDLVHKESVCTDPDPVRTQAAGGAIDPTSLARAHWSVAIYGTCKATSEMGCSPPLSIQTWPACERSPADYTMAGETLQPTETLKVRGAPARFYGDNRLELSTTDLTVVLFGDSRELLLKAAEALRTTSDSPKQVDPGELLPEPVAGSEDGMLPC